MDVSGKVSEVFVFFDKNGFVDGLEDGPFAGIFLVKIHGI